MMMRPEPERQHRIDTIGEQLQAKIRSKVQVSTFLAGFASTLLGIEIARLWASDDIPQLLFVAIPFLLGGAFLYIYAVIKLDGLSMPKPFCQKWEDLPPDTKVEDNFHDKSFSTIEDLRRLKEAMVFYWVRLVYVATGLVGLSMAMMLIPW